MLLVEKANIIDFVNDLVDANTYIQQGKYIEGVNKIDLMGGKVSQLGGDFVNIDIQATKGINGSVTDLSKFIKPNSIDEIVCSSPQADFLAESTKVLKPGSKIYINGSSNNTFFNDINKELANANGFDVIALAQPLDARFSSLTFYFSDGIRKIPNSSMLTTVLIKK